jgi:hypothetical protein
VVLIILSSSIAAAAPFAGLWRFPEGQIFKQWTGDDSKALMKVTFALSTLFVAVLNIRRSIFQQLKGMSLVGWFRLSRPFWNSAILLAKMSLILNLLQRCQMPWNISTSSVLYLQNVVFKQITLHYLDNIHSFIIQPSSELLVRQMAYAHLLQSLSILRL